MVEWPLLPRRRLCPVLLRVSWFPCISASAEMVRDSSSLPSRVCSCAALAASCCSFYVSWVCRCICLFVPLSPVSEVSSPLGCFRFPARFPVVLASGGSDLFPVDGRVPPWPVWFFCYFSSPVGAPCLCRGPCLGFSFSLLAIASAIHSASSFCMVWDVSLCGASLPCVPAGSLGLPLRPWVMSSSCSCHGAVYLLLALISCTPWVCSSALYCSVAGAQGICSICLLFFLLVPMRLL